jgi:hypothetical protein
MYTDFSEAYDRLLHILLKFNLLILFGGWLLFWMRSYLTGRTQRIKLEGNLSKVLQCHSRVPQRSHLGPIYFILDINKVLDLYVSVLEYANDRGLQSVSKKSGPFQQVVSLRRA